MFGKNILLKQEIKPDFAVQSIFHTIQGEGPYAGFPAIFIRLAGCNLKCHFCDTDFMSNIDNRMTVPEIQNTLNEILFEYPNTRLVVITGGEPFRQDLSILIPMIQEELECHVQIETAGTLWHDKFDLMDWEHVDIICSPKTSKVHPRIIEKCMHWKYIVENGETNLTNGLPLTNTQDLVGKKSTVFSGPYNPNFKSMIWIQPCDSPDPIIKAANEKHALYVAMKYGYRFSYQVHKAVNME